MSCVLAIETSTALCSVAIQRAGMDYCETVSAPQQHAHLILPMVDKALADTGLSPNELDFLAFGEGPGAFTGLRIAAGVVQGLALGWNKPIVGVSSLAALAYQGFVETGLTKWWACLDARMAEIYVQYCEFDLSGGIVTLQSPQLVKADFFADLAPDIAGVGDLTGVYPQITQKFAVWYENQPKAQAVAAIALQQRDKAESLQNRVPQPVYLRNSVTG